MLKNFQILPCLPLNSFLVMQNSSFFFLFLVLPVYCYQPISLHPRAHMLSHVTPWTAVRQAPLSRDFSRQEYWSGLPKILLKLWMYIISSCISLKTLIFLKKHFLFNLIQFYARFTSLFLCFASLFPCF